MFNKNPYKYYTPVKDKYDSEKILIKTCLNVSKVIPEIFDSKDLPFFLQLGDFIYVYEIQESDYQDSISNVIFASINLPTVTPSETINRNHDLILLQMPKDIFDLITSEELYKKRIS